MSVDYGWAPGTEHIDSMAKIGPQPDQSYHMSALKGCVAKLTSKPGTALVSREPDTFDCILLPSDDHMSQAPVLTM